MATYKGAQGYSVQKLSDDPTASETAGQLWYNSTSGKFKISTEGGGSWATGGDYPAALRDGGQAGTQTACLGFAGNPGSSQICAKYNGTAWTLSGSIGTGRYALGGTGTQTAALATAGYSGTTLAVVEEFNGTSWTEVNNLTVAAYSSTTFGTQTAAVTTAAVWVPYPTFNTTAYEYDGTSWAAASAIPSARAAATGFGTQTAGMVTAGYSAVPSNPINTNGLDTIIDYDGTSWTVGTGTINTKRQIAGASGTAALALLFGGAVGGGYTANTESYNGTAWTEVANLATSRYPNGSPAGTQDAALAFNGTDAGSVATEEWNDPTYTIKSVTVS